MNSLRAGPPDGKTGSTINASSSIVPVSPKVQEELTYLVREIKLLQSLKHPSLCELREYYLSARLTNTLCLYAMLKLCSSCWAPCMAEKNSPISVRRS